MHRKGSNVLEYVPQLGQIIDDLYCAWKMLLMKVVFGLEYVASVRAACSSSQYCFFF